MYMRYWGGDARRYLTSGIILGIANSPYTFETSKWQCTSRFQDTRKESCRNIWKGTPWIGG